MIADLHTYQKQAEGEDSLLQLETQEDNGPTTLISHLNDPNNEAIIVQEDVEKGEGKVQAQKLDELSKKDHHAYSEENKR